MAASVAGRRLTGKQLKRRRCWRTATRRVSAGLRRQFGRMTEAVNFDELLDVHVGVNLGRVQSRVAEHLLDVTEIGAVLQHERCHRVPEHVARTDFADAGFFHVVMHQVAEHAGRQPASGHAQEHFAFVGFNDEPGAGFLQVFVEPRGGALAERQQAVFLALAFADHHGAAFQVEVVEAQAGEFLAPQPGRVKDFQDGAIAQADGCRKVGLIQNLFGFVRGENLTRQTLLDLGQLQIGGGIGVEVILSTQPFEKAPDGGQADKDDTPCPV